MAEPSPKTRQRIAEIFLPVYNGLHGTHYRNPPDPERNGQPYDLRWLGSRGFLPALEVQLVVGPLDPIGDRVRPKSVAKVQAAIQDWCNRRLPRGYYVSLGVEYMPHSALDVSDVVSFVTQLLEKELTAPPATQETAVLHRPRAYSNDPYPSVELSRLESETQTLVTATPGAFVPQTAPRLRAAIDRKSKWLKGHYSDLVLLVYFDVDGYGGSDVEPLRREAASGPNLFRELWGVSLWSPGERADRLWP